MARPSGGAVQTKGAQRGFSTKKSFAGSRDTNKFQSKPQKLIIQPRPDWHATDLPPLKTPIAQKNAVVPAGLVDKLHEHAQALLENEASTYAAGQVKTSSSYKFMTTIMSSGTWTDKVSALTLVVQESPVHTVKPLENLVGLASKRSRDQALMALGALKDLLDQSGVLPDRKLRLFSKQPGLISALQGASPSLSPDGPLPNGLSKEHLIIWAYEDQLKRFFLDVLKILERWCHDEIEFSRLRAIDLIWELLKDKPEQEENLLRMLVNKLGDTTKKVASKASYRLRQLQETHWNMTADIVQAVEADILLRPGQSTHAKYYAIITLNQLYLRTSNPEVANKLLEVYFSIFRSLLAQSGATSQPIPVKKVQNVDPASSKRKRTKTVSKTSQNTPEAELDDKLIGQVLTGIHRAFPYSAKDSVAFNQHFDTMFRITHSANFNTSLQALVLIQQISRTLQMPEKTDRYMRVLYVTLFDPRLFGSSKQPMYLNLLWRSLKEDGNISRVQAFVKRLLQTLSFHDPPFISLALYLVIELCKISPPLRSLLNRPQQAQTNGTLEDQRPASPGPEGQEARDAPASPPSSTTNGVDGAQNTSTPPGKQSPKPTQTYDPQKRDPQYANADKAPLWELTPYNLHHHPSITLFASHLLNLAPAPTTSQFSSSSSTTTPQPPTAPLPKPDPHSHTLTAFLDKFAYRNPKTRDTAGLRGQSLMQPALASSGATDSLVSSVSAAPSQTSGAAAATEVNSEAFWRRKAEDVRPEDAFFHTYFSTLNKGKKAQSRAEKRAAMGRKGRRGSGDEDVDVDVSEGGVDIDVDDAADEEGFDEDEVWRAIVGSKGGKGVDPDTEADGMDEDEEDESDGDLEGLEAAMGDSEGSEDEDDDDDEMDDDDEGSKDGSIVPGEEEEDATASTSKSKKSRQRGDMQDVLDADEVPFRSRPAGSVDVDKAADGADSDDDDDPFDLGGSDEGSSSEDEDEEAQGKGKRANVKKEMNEQEIRMFIAEEERKAKVGKKVGRKGRKAAGEGEDEDDDGAPRKRRKKMKSLPMFGSADEWAALLDRD